MVGDGMHPLSYVLEDQSLKYRVESSDSIVTKINLFISGREDAKLDQVTFYKRKSGEAGDCNNDRMCNRIVETYRTSL